ncbi:Golgi-associated plant pathogenesis-related protein 1-like isoform X1 [Amblyomma americanum]
MGQCCRKEAPRGGQMSSGNQSFQQTVTRVDGGVVTTSTRTTQRIIQVSETSGYPSDQFPTGHHVKRTVVTRTIKQHADGTEEVTEDVVTDDGVPRVQDKPKKGLFGFLGGRKDKTRVTIEEAPSDQQATSRLISDRKAPTKPLSDKEFRQDSLKWHNHYRAIHGVPPLKHSDELCRYAQEWADTLAKKDTFCHRPNNKYGENIYMAWSSDPTKEVTGREAVDSWYSEIQQHQFGCEPRSLGSGHFTQVVWKASTELGTARARTATGKLLVVANYNPAGNLIGSFAQNVPPPKK